MELQRPVYQNWQWSYKTRRKLCRGFSKLPMRIAISSSDSYARNSLSRLSIFKCPLGRPQFNRKERRLVVSNCRPSILSDLAEIGNQIVQNLKFFSDPKIPVPEDSGISDRNFVYDSLVENLMNQVSSLGSFDIFAATLGFVAGLALYLSRFKQQNSVDTCARNAGDWILFTSPTPFNRFVVLRCPSIAFQDGALLEDVNRKLAKDNRHFVKLSSGSEVSGYSCEGRIPSSNSLSRSPVDSHNFDINGDGSELCYQRICLNAEDGGVVSLDWPASLDLAEEQGLDTTVLLVPGTTEGSRDECVQDFVRKALQYGYFPVVMNPRGCGGSPLTTPRLFTASDSDDVSMVTQFIARARPWTTLTGVGWGYGANMLSKYLGEVADTTPLTAVVCIGNPFDLEEANKSLSHHTILDQKLTKGLKDILQRNKALFQGKKQRFDVTRGLSATSVREFETAISRVVYGFDTIEEFYTKASTREIIGRVKIPVLYIQNDDIMAPVFSIPRSAIEGNPFTSLLLCSSLSSGYSSANGQDATIQWCDNLVLEWLAAVELALLKGRHPLLKDVDITIKPPKDSDVIARRLLEPHGMDVHGTHSPFIDSAVKSSSNFRIQANADKHMDVDGRNAFHVFSGEHVKTDKGDHTFKLKNKPVGLETSGELNNGELADVSQETGHLTEAEGMVEDSEKGQEDEIERGQVLQTAETVMRMLDVTMPGILAHGQKKQVLSAVERGETLITALQGAVPEDVRGKLTTAVSAAVQSRGINLKLVGFSKGIQMPSLPVEMGPNIQEDLAEVHKGKVEEPAIDTVDKAASPTNIEGKASPEAIVSETDTTRQQEMVNIKSNTENLGEHGSNETLKSEDLKSKTDQKNSSSDSYGFESQMGTKSKEAIELDTCKLYSNGKEHSDVNSSKFKRIQDDVQHRAPANDGIQEKPVQIGDNEIDIGCSEATGTQNQHQKGDKRAGSEQSADEQNKGKGSSVEANGKFASEQSLKREMGPDQKNDDKSMNSQGDYGKQNTGTNVDNLSPQGAQDASKQNAEKESTVEANGKSASEQQAKIEANPDQKNDIRNINGEGDQSKQNSGTKTDELSPQGGSSSVQPTSISVAQALDALTGFDDSTQMAVTNVFGVIENMIEQLEKEKRQKAEDKNGNEAQDLDHLSFQEGSSECNDRSRLGKEEQRENVSPDVCVSSKNVEAPTERSSKDKASDGRHANINQDLRDIGKGGSLPGLNQVQQQEADGSQVVLGVKKNSSELGDGVCAKGSEHQNVAPSKQEGKGSGVVSVNPSRTMQKVDLPLKAKSNDLGTFTEKKHHSVKYSSSAKSIIDSQDIDSTSDLFLEYVAEEGQWKLLDQTGSSSELVEGEPIQHTMKANLSKEHIPFAQNISMNIIEPSYVILDTELELDDSQKESGDSFVQDIEEDPGKEGQLSCLVNNLVMDALRLEVLRRLGMTQMEALGFNLEEELRQVAAAVTFAVKEDLGYMKNASDIEDSKLYTLDGELIVAAISSVLRGTHILGRLIPLGVIVGASLAALRPVFLVGTGEKYISDAESCDVQSTRGIQHKKNKAKESLNRQEAQPKVIDPSETNNAQEPNHEVPQNTEHGRNTQKKIGHGGAMVGAVTAAIGATAALASCEVKKTSLFKNSEHVEVPIDSHLENTSPVADDGNTDETGQEKCKSNIVSSLAEKAMSVAAPVVPTKRDGEVDHERLVAVLADLGQKGGVLRLIGKAALLWGGLRGAMSLTDRLIGFLHIAERPLHQRLIGFACMALLLWSPVVVPLLPTLIQHWTLHTSGGGVGCATIVGLYGALVILVTIWGKRIRGYEKPLEQYGLTISSTSKLLDLGRGLVIGLALVISLFSAKVFLGYATLTLIPEFSFSSPTSIVFAIKTYWRILRVVGQAFGMGLAVATVEELLFRSWLHEEIAADLGFHKAVILSGLVFSLIHWSLPVMPGLWLLSVALSGARVKGNGNLSVPIGLHTGLIAGNFIIHAGGFIRYNSNAPAWITGSYAGHPLAGALGLSLVATLAILLYPWEIIRRHRSMDFNKQASTF